MVGLFNGNSMVTERAVAQLITSRFPCVDVEAKRVMWKNVGIARNNCALLPRDMDYPCQAVTFVALFTCSCMPTLGRSTTVQGGNTRAPLCRWIINDKTYGVAPVFIFGKHPPMEKKDNVVDTLVLNDRSNSAAAIF